MTATTLDPTAFVCIPGAIPAHVRNAHFQLAERLLAERAERRRDLPDGYAFRFANAAYDEVVAFVGNERKCCPALAFGVDVEAAGGPVWLRITGPAGAREFIAAELPIGRASRSA